MTVFNYARPGDVVLSHNNEEIGNSNPGFWNHSAVLSVNGWIVEAQPNLQGPDTDGGVIAVPVVEFERRYPEILVVRFGVTEPVSVSIAYAAAMLIGKPYAMGASWLNRWRRRPKRGHNCVSVVSSACGQWVNCRGWRRPDHILRRTPKRIAHKLDYAGWVMPDEWFAGMTSDRQDVYGMRTV